MTSRSIAIAAYLAFFCVSAERPSTAADQQSRPASIPPPPAPPSPEEWQRELRTREAYQLHGIVEAARANGGEYSFAVDMSGASLRAKPVTLRALVQLAPLIIAGRVESASPLLSENKKDVMTSYEIEVREVLKGSASSRLAIRIGGGRLEFPDGAVAEVRTPGFAIEVGKEYVFCVRPPADGASTDLAVKGRSHYFLSGAGSQGIVDVSGEHIMSLTGAKLPIRAVLDDKPTPQFLAELRDAIRETAPISRANPK